MTSKPRRTSRPSATFPERLHDMMEFAESCGDRTIVEWILNGRGFQVHDQERLVRDLLPLFFGQTKYTSFRRQLNMWDFTRCGSYDGAFMHPYFVRGQRHLSLRMSRLVAARCGQKVGKKGKKDRPKAAKSAARPERAASGGSSVGDGSMGASVGSASSVGSSSTASSSFWTPARMTQRAGCFIPEQKQQGASSRLDLEPNDVFARTASGDGLDAFKKHFGGKKTVPNKHFGGKTVLPRPGPALEEFRKLFGGNGALLPAAAAPTPSPSPELQQGSIGAIRHINHDVHSTTMGVGLGTVLEPDPPTLPRPPTPQKTDASTTMPDDASTTTTEYIEQMQRDIAAAKKAEDHGDDSSEESSFEGKGFFSLF